MYVFRECFIIKLLIVILMNNEHAGNLRASRENSSPSTIHIYKYKHKYKFILLYIVLHTHKSYCCYTATTAAAAFLW